MSNPIAAELLAARNAEHSLLADEYRKLVWLIVGGETPDAAAANDVLNRLGISDSDLDGDVDAGTEHRQKQRDLDEFRRGKPAIEKQLAELTKQIAEAQEAARKAADLHHADLLIQRNRLGEGHNQERRNQSRVDELERQHPRIFGGA